MITPYNLLRHELVGLKVVAKTKAATFRGEVVSESAKTLTIKTPSGEKKAVKDSTLFEFRLPGDAFVEVDGSLFVARPFDRIKKKQRIRF